MASPALPARADLTERRQRAAAAILRGALRAYEGAKDRLLVDPPPPVDGAVEEDSSSGQPGDVLGARPVEVRLFRHRVDADAWQVRFRTSTADGTPSVGVATLLRPRRRRSDPPRLLAYQPAIDSLGPAGDPSYALQRGDHLEAAVELLALRRGWTVLVVDWTGPHRSFVDLPSAARFVLDGVRATLRFEPAGLDAATPVGLWGYSGGALATLFAAERHPTHAPELRVSAVAAGGGGVDITSSPGMFEAGNLLSGIPFGACVAAARAFPDFDLEGHLTPLGRTLVAAAGELTMEQLALGFPFLRMSRILTVPSVGDVPGAQPAFEATRCGQAVPTAPTFLYHAVHDQATAVADVDRLVATYRAGGTDVTYRRYRLGEHLIVMARAIRPALRFLETRVANS